MLHQVILLVRPSQIQCKVNPHYVRRSENVLWPPHHLFCSNHRDKQNFCNVDWNYLHLDIFRPNHNQKEAFQQSCLPSEISFNWIFVTLIWPDMFNLTDKMNTMNTKKSKIFKGNKQAYFSPVHMNLRCLKLSQIRVAQFPSTAPQGISAPLMSDVQSAVKIYQFSLYYSHITGICRAEWNRK